MLQAIGHIYLILQEKWKQFIENFIVDKNLSNFSLEGGINVLL